MSTNEIVLTALHMQLFRLYDISFPQQLFNFQCAVGGDTSSRPVSRHNDDDDVCCYLSRLWPSRHGVVAMNIIR